MNTWKLITIFLKSDEQEAEEQCQEVTDNDEKEAEVTDNNEEEAEANSSPSQYLLRHYSALKHTHISSVASMVLQRL
jgi:hypothetical protein